MSGIVENIIANALKPSTWERGISLMVDLVICFSISTFPMYGWVVAVLYFLFRDIIPIGYRTSLGKSVYNLRLMSFSGLTAEEMKDSSQLKTPGWLQVFVRNIVTFIPLVNIYDLYLFFVEGERLADQWSDTKVVKMTEAELTKVKKDAEQKKQQIIESLTTTSTKDEDSSTMDDEFDYESQNSENITKLEV